MVINIRSTQQQRWYILLGLKYCGSVRKRNNKQTIDILHRPVLYL